MSDTSKESKTQKREVDMSPSAIAARLEEVRQLYRLCMSLMQAKKL